MQLNLRTFYTSRYASLCTALLLSLCSRFCRLCFMEECFYTFLCSVLLVRNYFHNSVHERRKFYFGIFQIAVRPAYLYVVGIIVSKRTLIFPQIWNNHVVFPYPPVIYKRWKLPSLFLTGFFINFIFFLNFYPKLNVTNCSLFTISSNFFYK